MLDIALLNVGDVKETSVGGMKQGHPARKVDTHDPELGIPGHEIAGHDSELHGNPVQMQEPNGR